MTIPVTDPGLRAFVLHRDRACILSIVTRDHGCRDRWGEPHRPDEPDKLTIERVRERRDDPGWLVAMCAAADVEHTGSTTETRRLIDAYLAGVRNQEAAQ